MWILMDLWRESSAYSHFPLWQGGSALEHSFSKIHSESWGLNPGSDDCIPCDVSKIFSGSQSGVGTEGEAWVEPGAVVQETGDGAIWMERRQKNPELLSGNMNAQGRNEAQKDVDARVLFSEWVHCCFPFPVKLYSSSLQRQSSLQTSFSLSRWFCVQVDSYSQ